MDVPLGFVSRFKQAKEEFKRYMNERADVWFEPLLNELAELTKTPPKSTTDQWTQVSPDDINNFAVPKTTPNHSTNGGESNNSIIPGEANDSVGKILDNSAPTSASRNIPQAQKSPPGPAKVVPVLKSKKSLKRSHTTSTITKTSANKQQKTANNEVPNQPKDLKPSTSRIIKIEKEDSIIVEIENKDVGDSKNIQAASVEAQIDQNIWPSLTCKYEGKQIEVIDPNDDSSECECTRCVKIKDEEMWGATEIITIDPPIDLTSDISLNVDDYASPPEHINSLTESVPLPHNDTDDRPTANAAQIIAENQTVVPVNQQVNNSETELSTVVDAFLKEARTQPKPADQRQPPPKNRFPPSRRPNTSINSPRLARYSKCEYIVLNVLCTEIGCGQRFSGKTQLEDHVLRIHGRHLFACPLQGCRLHFGERNDWYKHLNQVHRGVPFECNQCGFLARTAYSLHTHVICAHYYGAFGCAAHHCGFVGECRNHVIEHFQEMHGPGAGPVPGPFPPPPPPMMMMQNVQQPPGLLPHPLPPPPSPRAPRAPRAPPMRKFVIIHNKCPDCQMTFTPQDQDIYYDHLFRYHSKYPNRCLADGCNQTFETQNALQNHYKNKNLSIWKCSNLYCGQQFSSFNDMHLHVVFCHHEGLYACTWNDGGGAYCRFQAPYRYQVVDHYDAVHLWPHQQ